MSLTLKYNFAQVARESGFQLRSYRDGHLDWRLVGSVEIERLLREQNLEQIDSVLGHLAEVPLGTLLETNILDTGIAKYFLLSQFAIQYLLFIRKFLEETVADLKEAHGSGQLEVATLKRSLSEANIEILQLHKKVTQMEAIHEVIYPCHLCTKNFVSNDALNLHISRKHSAEHVKHQFVRSETPATSSKERENDLNLINAIKLELEVKHLKERLNNAERKINENSNDGRSTDDKEFACGKQYSPVKHNVGIQSNLCEMKENDDVMDSNTNLPYESSVRLNILQENMEELNQWKTEQQRENREFLNDIESKFMVLAKALENAQKQQKCNVEKNEHLTTNSFRELEVFLNEKVEAIVKTSGAKMDEVVNKMEINYSRKLEKLEKQLGKLTKQTENSTHAPDEIKAISETVIIEDKPEVVLVKDAAKIPSGITTSQPTLSENSLKSENIKYIQLKDHRNDRSEAEYSDQSGPPSNNTYVKSNRNAKELDTDDSTEISDGFEDEDNIVASSLAKTKKQPNEFKNLPRRPQQKPVTRKMVRKLTDTRLLSLGIDKNTKSLTQTSMRHITDELGKRRNISKSKHPNFYATRNKIKKFVDKLCSAKMPEKAGKLLKAIKEPEKSNKQSDSADFVSSDEDSDIFIQPTNISTPVNPVKAVNDNDFRQRLENILASPIKKPEDLLTYANEDQPLRPVPMPRKRVMFTQERR